MTPRGAVVFYVTKGGGWSEDGVGWESREESKEEAIDRSRAHAAVPSMVWTLSHVHNGGEAEVEGARNGEGMHNLKNQPTLRTMFSRTRVAPCRTRMASLDRMALIGVAVWVGKGGSQTWCRGEEVEER